MAENTKNMQVNDDKIEEIDLGNVNHTMDDSSGSSTDEYSVENKVEERKVVRVPRKRS